MADRKKERRGLGNDSELGLVVLSVPAGNDESFALAYV